MDIHNNYGYPEMNYGYPEMNYGYPYFFRYPKFILNIHNSFFWDIHNSFWIS